MIAAFVSEHLGEEGRRLLAEDQRLKADPEFKVPDSFVQAGKRAIRGACKPAKRASPRILGKIAMIAALMMLLTASAGALGLHYFWDKLEWDEDHFSFGDAQYSEEVQETDAPLFENWDEDKVYGSLQEALDDFGITEFAEPTWLPEGYEYYGELYVYCDPECNILLMNARYENEEHNISVLINYAPFGEEHNTQYQRSGDTYEEYICGDYTCLLFPNLDTQKIVWLTPNYECSVSGWLTYDELKMIIDSIYLEE